MCVIEGGGVACWCFGCLLVFWCVLLRGLLAGVLGVVAGELERGGSFVIVCWCFVCVIRGVACWCFVCVIEGGCLLV